MDGEELVKRWIERMIRRLGLQGWWVMAKVPFRDQIARLDREVDVLVGVPGRGILAIEVKSWLSFTVDGVRWFDTSNHTCQARSDPFNQAHQEVAAVVHDLERNEGTARRPWVESAVVFTHISRHALGALANGHGHLVPHERIATRDELDVAEVPTKERARQVRRRLLDFFSGPVDAARNSEEALEKVRQRLAGRVTVDSLDLRLREITEALDRGTEMALSGYAEGLGDVHELYVEGLAGTGKTVLALTLAAMRARRFAKPSLYLCSSDLLRLDVDDHLHRHGIDDIVAHTPETLFTELVGRPPTEYVESDRVVGDLRAEVARSLGVTHPSATAMRAYLSRSDFWEEIVYSDPGEEYACIAVDEAQDFPPAVFHHLRDLQASGGLFAVFADPVQVTRPAAAGHDWTPPLLQETRHLSTNYRNTVRVVEHVEGHVRACPDVRFAQVHYVVPPHAPSGESPDERRWQTPDDLCTGVSEIARELSDRSIDVGTDVKVLVSSSVDDDTFSLLHAAAAPALVLRIDAFRGLESPVVVVITADPGAIGVFEATAEQDYVGMTRPTALLYVLKQAK